MNTLDLPLQHAEQPRVQPLEGPACWTGASLAPEQWLHQLTANEVDELCRAVERTASLPVDSITQRGFALPTLGPRLKAILESLLNGPGLCMLRGLPVDGMDEDALARMLWGIGVHLGIPQPQDAAGALIHHVRDTGVSVAGRDDVRTFETKEAQPWHNDGGDVFALMCVETSTMGGGSMVASAYTVFNELLARDPQLIRTLQEVFHFDARGQQLAGQGRVQQVPIFTWHDQHMYLLHKRHYIDHAQRFEEVPRLTQAQCAALDAFEEICEDPNIHMAFDLEPGDLEIGHNFNLLHRRAAFDEASDKVSARHLMRLWLGLENGWPLPEVYRTTREYGHLFSIRKPT
jgi:hypothetical protein